MAFYTLVLQLYLKNEQKKREDDTFLTKKTREKQNIATIMKSVDGIGIVLPIKLKLQKEWFE